MANNRVAIIGLGPTGAFAARAAYDLGWDVKIYATDMEYRTPPGAFWLHWIPDAVLNDYNAETINILGIGKAEEYVKRQWGKEFAKLPSSFPVKPVAEKGYDPAEVLPHLVPAECEFMPVSHKLSDVDVRDIARAFDVVFQTFPTRESTEQQPALIPYIAAARFGWEPRPGTGNMVVYNGSGKGVTVREAQLFGNHYLEFPKNMSLAEVGMEFDLTGYQHVVLRDLHPYTKPWQQDSKSKVQLIGRFAKWDRKCLSHDAYADVRRILKGFRNANA